MKTEKTVITAVYTKRSSAQRAGRDAKRSLLVPFGSKDGHAHYRTYPASNGFWELVLTVPMGASRTCPHCGEATLYGSDLLNPCVLCKRDMFSKG